MQIRNTTLADKAREPARYGETTRRTKIMSKSKKSTEDGHAALDMAQAMAVVGDFVGTAGDNDLAQGAEALAAAQQIEIHSEVVAALSSDDLERSMKLGAIAGQLNVASEIAYGLQVPELAAFLRTKSEELHAVAVEGVQRFGVSRALSEVMAETSNQIGVLGANEMLEGMARQEVADAAFAMSDDLMAASGQI
jgi:hypothetical protein